MTKIFFVIQCLQSGEFITNPDGKTVPEVQGAAHWTDLESAKIYLSEVFNTNLYRVMEVHPTVAYNLAIPKDDLQEIVNKLSLDEIRILEGYGLVLTKGTHDPVLGVRQKYERYSKIEKMGNFSIDVGIILHILKKVMTHEEEVTYPDISDCIIGNDRFKERLSGAFFRRDEDGDLSIRHPDFHWDYWDMPSTAQDVFGIFGEILDQCDDGWGIFQDDDDY